MAKKAKVVWNHRFGQEKFRAVRYEEKGKERISFEMYSGKDLLGNEIWLDIETQADLDYFKSAIESWFVMTDLFK